MAANQTIIISIVTFRRPDSLANTLQSLKKIILPPNTKVKLIVIDNDAQGTAMGTVNSIRNEMPFPVEYIIEEERGIPYARNKALQAASDGDYIAFIDDDDTAEAEWLSALYNTAQAFNADVVKGQVVYQFPEEKYYLSALDIFSPIRLPTGSELDSAWTNNVLFSTKIYKENGLLFDSAFLKTGGSDSHFFRLAKNNGAKIIMCQEAIVNAHIPRERTTWKWLAFRNMRVGATTTISDIKTNGFRHAAGKVVQSVSDSIKYIFRLLPGVFNGNNHIIHPSMVGYFIFGRITGLFHISPREYK